MRIRSIIRLQRMISHQDKPSYEELEKQFHKLKKELEVIKANSGFKDHECCKESERLRKIIENSRAGYFFINNEGIIENVNNAWLKLYKYNNRDEVIGKHFVEIQQIDDIEDSKLFVEGIRKQDPNFTTGEFSRKCKDGSTGYHSFSAKPVFDKNNLIGIEGFIIDITERVEIEKKLRDSEEKYKALYENAPLSYQSLDINGNFIDVNPTWLSTLGYKREEVIGKNYGDFLHPAWKSHFDKNFPEFKRRGYVSDVEFKIRHKNGSYLDISFEGCIGTHPDGSFKQTYCVFKDTTESKLIEQALTKNQYYLAKAQEIGKIGTWEMDVVNNKLYWTKENYKVFGIKPGTKLNYEVFKNCVHPDDVEYVDREWLAALKGKPYDIEHRVVAHGITKWVREKADIRFDEQGNAISAIGFTQEITSFKETEFKLKESEERFRQITNYAQEWIWEVDKNGLFTYSSPVIESLLGYTPDEIVGKKHFYDLYLLTDRRARKEIVLNLFKEKKEIKNFVNTNVHKSGQEIWLSTSAVPMFNQKGELIGYRGLNEDITERRMAELALESIAKQFSMLSGVEFFENVCGHLTENLNVDIAFVGKFIENKRVKVIAGVDTGELIEQFRYDLAATPCNDVAKGEVCFYDNGVQALFPKDILLLEMGIEAYAGIPLIGRSGDPLGVFVLLNRNPLQSKDLYLNLLHIFSGKITAELERMEAEQSLKHALKKAEESDRLKTAFLSNMSHEIRTPMNGIVGFTELLQDPDLPEINQREYVNIIQKSSERLLSTVNDIIEISKIESGVVSISNEELNIIELLESFVDFFIPEANKKDIEITFENKTGLPDLRIETDKIKIGSIVSNLIKNSIKYTQSGYIKVGLKHENKNLLFYCKDSGIGIPKHRHEAIFNRFEQADLEDKQAHEGSGLGLAIVKSYVEMLDGKIWVESEETKGTCFCVTLPVGNFRLKENQAEMKTKVPSSGKKDIRILIVEDDEISSLHLSVISKDVAKTVHVVNDGLEALSKLKNDPGFDLIFMDIKMPVMDGLEATKRIREFNSEVIIIAQTAFAFYEDHENALAAGCNDFISKPIKKAELIGLINKYF